VLAADSIQEVKDEEKYNKLTKDEPVWFLHKKEGDSDKLGTPFSNAAKEHQHILTFGEGGSDLASSTGGFKATSGEFVAHVEKDEVTYFPKTNPEDADETAEALNARLDHW
jgi:hypothetical protein